MAVFNEIGNQDILTGSASGTTQFFFSRTGDLTLAGDLTIRGGDLVTSTTSFNLLTAATTLSVGAGSGTTTINNALTVTGTTTTNGTLTVNSDVITLGNATTDALTFTARVAQDADLIPITATGTNDLGTTLLPWDTLYVGTIPGFTLSGAITGSGTPTLSSLGTINGATLSGGTLSGGTYSNTGLTVTGSYTATIGNAGTFAWSDGSNTLMSLVDDGTSGNLGLGTTPVHKLHLSGAVTGKALAVFNETGDQNIFSASQSGISVFNLARTPGTAANGFTLTPATTGNTPTFAAER
jgi:hypothetical protein